MTFETFPTASQEDLADEIADRMIAIDGGHWSDGDPAINNESDPKGRVLKYTNGGEVIYFSFIKCGWGRDYAGDYVQLGLMVFISSSWDLVNHIPDGTIWTTVIPMSYKTDIPLSTEAGSGQAFMWWDDDNLCLMYKHDSSSNYDNVTIFVIERDTTKEYADGYTNFYTFVDTAKDPIYHDTSNNYRYRGRSYTNPFGGNWSGMYNNTIGLKKFLHPFGCQYGNGTDGYNQYEKYPERALCLFLYDARMSQGNGKIYICFGWTFNDQDWDMLSLQKKWRTFFPVAIDQGLADGDVINVTVGEDTEQFLYKQLTSPDGGYLSMAMRYA